MADTAEPRLDCVAYTFIVDDIVLHDGKTCMAQLGGGGSQFLFGFQVAHSALSGGMAGVGLTAGVGQDIPESCLAQLHNLGCDTQGLITYQRPTPRAWQVFEADGRRTQVWRTKGDPTPELDQMLQPPFARLPPRYQRAVNYHIGVHPLYPPLELLRQLRKAAHAQGGLLSVETFTAAERPATWPEVQALVSECDVFSPNEGEAESLVGHGTFLELTDRLLEAVGPHGPKVIILRCAEKGVVARLGHKGPVCEVPAVQDTHVVDVTGAGNSCCGGFLGSLYALRATQHAALWRHLHTTDAPASDDTLQAAADALSRCCAWGCVSASLMIESTGVPPTRPTDATHKALQRHAALMERVRVSAPRSRTAVKPAARHSGMQAPTRIAYAHGTSSAFQVSARHRAYASLRSHGTVRMSLVR